VENKKSEFYFPNLTIIFTEKRIWRQILEYSLLFKKILILAKFLTNKSCYQPQNKKRKLKGNKEGKKEHSQREWTLAELLCLALQKLCLTLHCRARTSSSSSSSSSWCTGINHQPQLRSQQAVGEQEEQKQEDFFSYREL
jgi:hypothetical protein